ncbi:redoxin domain-containing protein [Tundrisphaera sp. TA3]|uniref:redoxin domain-containing protein n=1 Tax=Tundrisphaera sp. TA3 TaxID=3435775 RepID=UPI003EB8B677
MRQWFLSLAALALVASPAFAGKFNKVLSIGDKAPAIAGIPAVDGDKEITMNLADVKEDVVVVVFLANHCPVVQAVEDRLHEMVSAYKGKSVKFVGVCCTGTENLKEADDIAAIKQKIKEDKYNLTYAYDESGKVGKAFGATVTPQVFVLDKNRTVQYTGLLDDSQMNESKVTKPYTKLAVDALLAGDSVETPETKQNGCGVAYKR